MKKLVFFAAIALMVIGTVSARPAEEIPPGRPPVVQPAPTIPATPPAPPPPPVAPRPEPTRVQGSLVLQDGQVSLTLGAAVFSASVPSIPIPGLEQILGVIEGFPEGVQFEGFLLDNTLHLQRLIIGDWGFNFDIAIRLDPEGGGPVSQLDIL